MCCCKDKEDKAFDRGIEILDNELDIVRLVKRNRELHTYLKYLLSDRQRWMMKLESRRFITKEELDISEDYYLDSKKSVYEDLVKIKKKHVKEVNWVERVHHYIDKLDIKKADWIDE